MKRCFLCFAAAILLWSSVVYSDSKTSLDAGACFTIITPFADNISPIGAHLGIIHEINGHQIRLSCNYAQEFMNELFSTPEELFINVGLQYGRSLKVNSTTFKAHTGFGCFIGQFRGKVAETHLLGTEHEKESVVTASAIISGSVAQELFTSISLGLNMDLILSQKSAICINPLIEITF